MLTLPPCVLNVVRDGAPYVGVCLCSHGNRLVPLSDMNGLVRLPYMGLAALPNMGLARLPPSVLVTLHFLEKCLAQRECRSCW